MRAYRKPWPNLGLHFPTEKQKNERESDSSGEKLQKAGSGAVTEVKRNDDAIGVSAVLLVMCRGYLDDTHFDFTIFLLHITIPLAERGDRTWYVIPTMTGESELSQWMHETAIYKTHTRYSPS